MDRNFHIDDFERLLREMSEEFRMYPSKRIWHSIYNNIHPSRKWPSVVMCITLITGLLLIGYLNTNNTTSYSSETDAHKFNKKIVAQKKSVQFVSNTPNDYLVKSNPITGIIKDKTVTSFNSGLTKSSSNKIVTKLSPASQSSLNSQFYVSDEIGFQSDVTTYNPRQKDKINTFKKEINFPTGLSGDQIIIASDIKKNNSFQKTAEVTNSQTMAMVNKIEFLSVKHFADENIEMPTVATINHGGNSEVEKNKLAIITKTFISKDDIQWMENYALYNRPAAKKWANKLELQLYATPSIVYRILYNNPNFGNAFNSTPFAVSPSNQDINMAVIQKPSIGLEIGTGLKYAILKGVKLKAGLQLNYTRYNSNAFQNTHPVSTRLLMHDYETNNSYEEYKTTPYSNKNGLESVKLHNVTFQVALPIGTELELIGNKNIQWNLGLTIQPTYVVGGKSYLISSDRRNYVKETSLINNWNVNAGFETFITFKSNGLTYQLGPQFRTQLFSTNSKKYTVEERLFNFGLKFGISKNLK